MGQMSVIRLPWKLKVYNLFMNLFIEVMIKKGDLHVWEKILDYGVNFEVHFPVLEKQLCLAHSMENLDIVFPDNYRVILKYFQQHIFTLKGDPLTIVQLSMKVQSQKLFISTKTSYKSC